MKKGIFNYSQTVVDAYENLENYNTIKKSKVLIVFDDATVDMEANEIFSFIVTELFVIGRKLNISLAFKS